MHSKSNHPDVDAIDLGILEALQEDARQTYASIGLKLGIAHSTVYDRIRRMEEQGVILKYTALLNPAKTCIPKISALMTIFTDPKESENVAEELCRKKEVLEVYTSLSEELLIIAKVAADTQEKLHDFIANSVAPLKGVLRIRTSIITKRFKDTLPSVSAPERVNLSKTVTSAVGDNQL